jgi:hypothetical protein
MGKHATEADAYAAYVVIAALVFLEVVGYPVLTMVAASPMHWVVRLAMMVFVIGLVLAGYPLTALVVTILAMRFCHLMNTQGDWTRMAMAKYAAAAAADPRFDASSEVDLQMANGTLAPSPPRILAPPSTKGPLLLFPPTAQQLVAISGSA